MGYTTESKHKMQLLNIYTEGDAICGPENKENYLITRRSVISLKLER